MELTLDSDVKKVMEFMQENIAANKLLGVSESLPKIAKLLWDRYPQEEVYAVNFSSEAPSA